MKSTFVITILFCLIINSNAQSKVESFEFFNDMKGNRIVVVDTAILRVGPSAGAANTDTLFLGEEINVLMPVPYFEQVGLLDVPWLKITYFKRGYTKVSYILANQVSLTKSIEIDTKKILIAIQPNKILKEKFIHVLGIKNNKIVQILAEQIPKDFTVDSIQLSIAENPCLNNSSAMFNLQLKSNKAEEGLYNKWIVFCENQQLISLPFTHNYFNTKYNAVIEEKIVFPNQNNFRIYNKQLNKKAKEIILKFRWEDCNYLMY